MIEDEKDLVGLFYITIVIFAVALTGVSYLNSFYKKNIQKESEPPLIVCSFCKGKGEISTDINKLMMDASLALFLNHHMMVDKCEKCVKLPYGDGYEYCDTVENKYQTLLQEYAVAGPKIDMAACSECMGMGTFSSKDLSTGQWHTQQTWDEQHSKENKHE
jgi:hypothetical protein